MKRKLFWWVLAIGLLILTVLALRVVEGRGQDLEPQVYLPVVARGFDPRPTATLAPTSAPTPTTMPTATPAPQWMPFLTGYDDRRMKGLPTGGVRRTSMTDYWGNVVYPKGVFIVLFMNVVNHELTSGYVSGIGTFWMRDGGGPFFDMADLEMQWAAEDEYGRMGVYEDLQPQFVYEMVFAFDVPPQGTYNLWYRPWGSSGAVHIEEDRAATIVDESALGQLENWRQTK